ncbi:MAG: pyridoxine 5'-phosphate synthase [Acidobacteria bacterium]|nr:MAG: pyridoxine 5'-phosphate synthase [Acidobacteriota bacterium]REK11695.1 MAG: pyridoxine 5'-phosphate synthase [Acidobacteriota bacterium]
MAPSADSGAAAKAAARSVQLSVNVDHVATLRQARRADYPDPVDAARIAESAGASGITVHLREDRRHIQDHDLAALAEAVRGKLNLEIAGTVAMLEIAERHRPGQVTLVPERPDEITTEGGLDLVRHSRRVQRAANTLAESGIAVSIFLDPEEAQVDCAVQMENIAGIEINTDHYTRAERPEGELEEIRRAAARAAEAGISVYAGHGLTTTNVGAVAAVPQIEELNIGHSIVSRAVLVGFEAAVKEMLEAIRRAS